MKNIVENYSFSGSDIDKEWDLAIHDTISERRQAAAEADRPADDSGRRPEIKAPGQNPR